MSWDNGYILKTENFQGKEGNEKIVYEVWKKHLENVVSRNSRSTISWISSKGRKSKEVEKVDLLS